MTTLAFTRPADRIAESVKMAEEMGFDVLAAPSLEVMDGYQEEYDIVDGLLADGKIDYAIFGSGTAVDMCVRRFGKERFIKLFSKPIIVAIGPNTSSILSRFSGLDHDIMPVNDHSSFGIIDAIGKDVNCKTVLLVRSDSGSEILLSGLKDSGAEVIDFASYRLKEVGMTEDLERIMDGILEGSVDVIAFTSPMSAESFFSLLDLKYGKARAIWMMKNVKVAAIGRPTSLKLESMGRIPDIMPERTTFYDMLMAIRNDV